jgi:hypothetical protein
MLDAAHLGRGNGLPFFLKKGEKQNGVSPQRNIVSETWYHLLATFVMCSK